MGQAKLRGNFKERQLAAIKRDIQEAIDKEKAEHERKKEKQRKELEYFDSLSEEDKDLYLAEKKHKAEEQARRMQLLAVALAAGHRGMR